MKTARNAFVGLISFLALVACTVQLVEDYDPVLDQGLSSYNADIAAFLAEMAAKSGTPEGAYDNPDVRAFYARTDAKLSSFVDRARALDDDGECLPADALGQGVQAAVDRTEELVAEFAPPLDGALGPAGTSALGPAGTSALGPDTSGNCTVVIVENLRENQDLLRTIHESETYLNPLIVSIVGPTIEQSARIAIQNEVLKKNRTQ